LLPVGAADPNREAADDACWRVTQAVADLAHERGLSAASAPELCRRAAISRADFDRIFPSAPEAIGNAFAEAFDSLFIPVREAAAGAPTWLEGLARALDALLEAAGEQPRLAELCLVHSPLAAKEAAGHDYRAAVEAVSAVVRTAREHAEAEGGQLVTAPALAEEFLAHGILFRAGQIAEHDGEAITPNQRGDLLMLVLMTFFGTADAARMCGEVEA
jgi:AcrR family transcriptional regulator